MFLVDFETMHEIMNSENPADLFIGGGVHMDGKTMRFCRGSYQWLTVPVTWLGLAWRSPDVWPDFDDFEITDYGQTVRLGEYEFAVDAILYSFDEDYRKRKDDVKI